MDQTNFDIILDELKDNRCCDDNEGQKRDADLICNLLRLKYNSIEIKDMTQILIEKINNCIEKKESWFCNY